MKRTIELPLSNTRNSSIELCRILSMIMIVGSHLVTHGDFVLTNDNSVISELWWLFLKMGGNFGTDVFVLITGYFLINDSVLSVNIHRITKLWAQIFFYSFTIYIIGIIAGFCDFTIVGFIESLFPIATEAWWFATTYFILYIIHPWINKLLLGLNRHQYQNFLIILLLIWCIIPTFTSCYIASSTLMEFVLLYSVAGYIRLHGESIRGKCKHCFLGWLITTIAVYLSSIMFIVLGNNITFLADRATYFMGKISLPTIIRAVFFFMMFERMTTKHSKIINTISSAVFGTA